MDMSPSLQLGGSKAVCNHLSCHSCDVAQQLKNTCRSASLYLAMVSCASLMQVTNATNLQDCLNKQACILVWHHLQ